jgi:hypothetical protein
VTKFYPRNQVMIGIKPETRDRLIEVKEKRGDISYDELLNEFCDLICHPSTSERIEHPPKIESLKPYGHADK